MKNLISILLFLIIFAYQTSCLTPIGTVHQELIARMNEIDKINNQNEKIERWLWNKEDYPNPFERPPFCKRPTSSYICDPDMILTQQQGILINSH